MLFQNSPILPVFAQVAQEFFKDQDDTLLSFANDRTSTSLVSFKEVIQDGVWVDELKKSTFVTMNLAGKSDDNKNEAVNFLEKAEIGSLMTLAVKATNVDMKFVDAICMRITNSTNLKILDLSNLIIEESIREEAHAKIAEAVLKSGKIESFKYPSTLNPETKEKVNAHTQKNSLPDDLIPLAEHMVKISKGEMYLCNPRDYGDYGGGLRMIGFTERLLYKNIAYRMAEAIKNDPENEELSKKMGAMLGKLKANETFDEKENLFLTACVAPIENIVFKKIEYPKYSFMDIMQKIWQFAAKIFYTPEKGNDFTKGYVNYNSQAAVEIATPDKKDKFTEALKNAQEKSGMFRG